MKRGTGAFRGRPVRALFFVLGGWVLARVALWPASIAMQALPPTHDADASPVQRAEEVTPAQPIVPAAPQEMPAPAWQPAPLQPAIEPPDNLLHAADPVPLADATIPTAPVRARYIVGHNLLLAAGLSSMELDPGLAPFVRGAGPRMAQPALAASPVFAPAAAARFESETTAPPQRWSMDAWALWRENDASPLLSGRPTYGRSQVGAVVRFALAPSSGHAPQAFLRASAALAGAREQEAAVGISARPLPFLPVRLAAEARLREAAAGTDTRLAAFAVSEFPPLALPGRTSGEAYVQGGYVTGRNATGFVDGQARITRDLAAGERFRISAGGGAWGGAQEGSGRLDIGPSASLGISAGGVNARVSADYRFRVAGTAQPASGPALTISAGF